MRSQDHGQLVVEINSAESLLFAPSCARYAGDELSRLMMCISVCSLMEVELAGLQIRLSTLRRVWFHIPAQLCISMAIDSVWPAEFGT